MLPQSPRFSFALVIGLVLTLPGISTSVLGDHPYYDRHFNLDSTPRSGSSMVANRADGFVSGYTAGSGTGTCASGTCARSLGGSGGGNCPPVQNAILRLWVPDGATVEINGHTTRPQTLGGIHQGSRVYSLDGLETNRVSPCDIIVCCFDEMGIHQRFHRSLAVQASGYYQLRFPDGFEQIWLDPVDILRTLDYPPAPAQPAPAQPVLEQPVLEQPSTEQPSTEQPPTAQPATEPPAPPAKFPPQSTEIVPAPTSLGHQPSVSQ
jgi:hypothetical protein